MPAVLALDQGTTGTTALLVHQDGTVLGRGYRELGQHYPRPGWVEHDPDEILRGSIEAMREALAGAAERPAGIGITNQRETVVLWDRRTLAPVAPAIVWQDRRTADRCAQLKDEGKEQLLRERTGLVADPYFSATKLEWLLRDRELRRRAERGELAAGTVESWLVARLTGGRAHVTDHTNASRTLLYGLAARDWDAELLSVFGVPAEVLPRIVRSAGIVAETDREHLGVSLPIAGLARSSARAAAPMAWRRTPTARAPFSWCTPAGICTRRRRGCSPRRRAARRASRPSRSREASSSRAPRCSGSGTASD
jgi:glycerol kinase